jgi:prevent-host-death family protein
MMSHALEPVSVTELNQQTTAVLRRVKNGESVPITERGKVVAYLTPPPPTHTGNPVIDQWIAEGRIRPPEVPGGILDLLPPPGPVDHENSLSRAILEERESS